SQTAGSAEAEGDGRPAMPRIVVVATGGTIASVSVSESATIAQRSAAELMSQLDFGSVEVVGRDLMNMGSYLLAHRELRLIAAAVAEELAKDEVSGVVVTHGTDTMEETAYLLDLVSPQRQAGGADGCAEAC